MAESRRLQLRSYETALGGRLEGDLVEAVQTAFENWPGVTTTQKEQIEIFSGRAEGMLKVFVLIPLGANEELSAQWNPGENSAEKVKDAFRLVKETKKDDVTIELEIGGSPSIPRSPLTIR